MAEPSAHSADRLAAAAALSSYDLPPHSQLQPIRTTNNAVFEVTAQGRDDHMQRYVLRVHRPHYRSVQQTWSELFLLQLLQDMPPDAGFSVPKPVPARDGALVVEVKPTPDAARHCDLLTWVDGHVRRPGRGLGPQAVHRLGQALAWVHQVTVALNPPPGFALPQWDAETMFGPICDRPSGPLAGLISPADWRLYLEVADRTRAVFAQLADEPEARGIVHFDFVLGNCHLRRDGTGWQAGIVDFDDCGWGYLLYDLCPLLGNLADFPGYPTRRRAFLAGYRSVRHLPTAWEAHLPLLMAARHVQCCLWTAQLEQTTGTGPPAADHIAMRMDLVRHCLSLPY
jgi:Ser/Thr protein kinase RdoA (MazF antagonist)